jgi:hypothetical protein
MRRLYSQWRRLTTMRKAMVVGIAVAAVIAALKNAFDVFTMLVLPCTILLLLIWGTSRLFDLLGGGKWSENIRVALALAVVVGFFLFCGFMMSTPEHRFFHHAELNAEMQEVRIEKNKVRIGMTINDVLPLVHGMEIFASADGVWLSVLPDNKRFYYSPDPINLWQHDDGTYSFAPLRVGASITFSRHRVPSSRADGTAAQAGQDLQNLTEPQAAALFCLTGKTSHLRSERPLSGASQPKLQGIAVMQAIPLGSNSDHRLTMRFWLGNGQHFAAARSETAAERSPGD